jgi:hypothetical protein
MRIVNSEFFFALRAIFSPIDFRNVETRLTPLPATHTARLFVFEQTGQYDAWRSEMIARM